MISACSGEITSHGYVDIPTLVRRMPSPIRKIIGDLSNEDKVLVGLDLRERT